jgi:hypothetical protein
VIQEALIPHTDFIAIYGEISAPIALIEDSDSILPCHYETGECCKKFWNDLSFSQRKPLDRFTQLMHDVGGIREMRENIQNKQLDMLILYLQRTRDREATDPRDKIFGLLGLIHDLPNPMYLVPGYKKSIAHVYTDLAMRIIRDERSLVHILSHEAKGSVSKLPT